MPAGGGGEEGGGWCRTRRLPLTSLLLSLLSLVLSLLLSPHSPRPHQARQHSGPRSPGGPGDRARLHGGGDGGQSLSSLLAVTGHRALHLLCQEILNNLENNLLLDN